MLLQIHVIINARGLRSLLISDTISDTVELQIATVPQPHVTSDGVDGSPEKRMSYSGALSFV